MIGAIGPSGGGGLANRLIAAGSGSAFALRGVGSARPGMAGGAVGPAGLEGITDARGTGLAGVRRETGEVRGTAYQRNRDGDEAVMSSRRGELTDEERREVESLESRDREVRTHEQAHVAAAGELFRGGPYYEYRRGPDGERYAVGGRVSIDTSPADTPEATIAKAAKIRAAALAPAEPSSADRAVAAKAAQMEREARAEQASSEAERAEGKVEGLMTRARGERRADTPVRPFDPDANAPERDPSVLMPTELRDPAGRPAGSVLGVVYA